MFPTLTNKQAELYVGSIQSLHFQIGNGRETFCGPMLAGTACELSALYLCSSIGCCPNILTLPTRNTEPRHILTGQR